MIFLFKSSLEVAVIAVVFFGVLLFRQHSAESFIAIYFFLILQEWKSYTGKIFFKQQPLAVQYFVVHDVWHCSFDSFAKQYE